MRLLACSNPKCSGWEWSSIYDHRYLHVFYYDKKHVFSYDPATKDYFVNTLTFAVFKIEDCGSRYFYLRHAPYIQHLLPLIMKERPKTEWEQLKSIPYWIDTAYYGKPSQNYISRSWD